MGGRDTITVVYATTKVIGYRTSFVIASVRSSTHWSLSSLRRGLLWRLCRPL